LVFGWAPGAWRDPARADAGGLKGGRRSEGEDGVEDREE